MANVAFIGLGVMGFPMAGHLAAKGHSVKVYNRTAAKAVAWAAAHKGTSAATPKEAASGCDMVFVCVGNDDDLLAVTLSEQGALAGMTSGSVLVDHTTASAAVARELAAAASALDIGFIDAPVSGGQAGAENGVLSVMCGGTPETFAKVEHVIASYAQTCKLLGPAGSGQLAKMVNQICIAGVVQGLSEGVSFAQKAGLDVEALVEVISKGAAGSWQMQNRATNMAAGKFDYGFAVDWMRKDLGICLAEAKSNGTSLPLTALVDQFYADIQKSGGSRWDTSSLITRLK